MATMVTGATGLLGNNVVRELLDRGEHVRVLVREQSGKRSLAGLNVETVFGDVCDARQVRAACQGMDVVVHAAGWVHIGWAGMQQARAVNVDGTHNVAVATAAAGARMIHISTINALAIGRRDQPADEETPRTGQVPCPYMVTKRAGEEAVQRQVAQGLDAVIVNPSLMLGPWDWKPSSGRLILEVAKRFAPLAPRGGCNVCDVRDVTQGVLAVIEKGETGRNYLLTGHNMPYIDLWRMIAATAGSQKPWWRVTPVGARIGGHTADLISSLRGRELEVNSAAIRIASQYHYYSCARAKAELDYQIRPAIEAVRDAWQWFKDYGYV